jgi:dolichol-phosphate mannosyltransferase
LISIVIPVYNEAKQIRESIRAIYEILQKNTIPHEFVLIDDGSKDNSWSILTELIIEFPGTQAIRFSRNFGKEAALCAGLDAVRGDAALIMDADLQHPPEIIPEMVRLWKNGYEIIEGVKTSRGKEKLSNRLFARLFYDILQRSSGFDLHNASDFKLLDAKVVAAWRQMPERHTFFRGMAAWVGFQRTTIPFVVAERQKGSSKWSKLRLFKLAVTAITSFSSIPLQIVTFLGIIFLLGAIPLVFQTLYLKFKGIALSGFTTVIVLLLIIGSILMISLGIIGMYIAKIFEAVKYRPRYLVAEKLEHGREESK